MITDRNLEQGMKLAARFKKVDYTAEVVEAEHDDVAGSKDEGLRIKLADGRVFRSVSSAAQAITGGSINGWRFWSLAEAAGRATKAKEPKGPVEEAAECERPTETSGAPVEATEAETATPEPKRKAKTSKTPAKKTGATKTRKAK